MDTKDMKIFRCVYEAASISQAAQIVYMTPQGVSKIIQKLENELGLTLFKRTSKGVVPTRYADQLYSKSSTILDMFYSISTDIQSDTALARVSAAFSYGVMAYFGFNLIEQFQKSYPSIRLDYIEDTDHKIESMIAQNQIDLAVIGMPMKIDQYDCQYLFSCRHVAVINKDHPYADKDFISYRDLNGQDLALIGRQFNPSHHNMQRFLQKQIQPNSVTETSEISYTHFFASQNKGIGLSVDFAAREHPYENTVIVPFEDSSFTWDVCIIFNKTTIPTEACQKFCHFIQNFTSH